MSPKQRSSASAFNRVRYRNKAKKDRGVVSSFCAARTIHFVGVVWAIVVSALSFPLHLFLLPVFARRLGKKKCRGTLTEAGRLSGRCLLILPHPVLIDRNPSSFVLDGRVFVILLCVVSRICKKGVAGMQKESTFNYHSTTTGRSSKEQSISWTFVFVLRLRLPRLFFGILPEPEPTSCRILALSLQASFIPSWTCSVMNPWTNELVLTLSLEAEKHFFFAGDGGVSLNLIQSFVW